MAVDLQRDPNYEVLIEALLEKTRAGRLVWHETADENTFLAALKGERTFEVTGRSEEFRRETRESGLTDTVDMVSVHIPIGNTDTVVRVRDEQGRVLFEIPPSPATAELYTLVRRIVTRVDENIDSTMEILEQL